MCNASMARSDRYHRRYAGRQQGYGSHRRPVEDWLVQKCLVKPAIWSTALAHDVWSRPTMAA